MVEWRHETGLDNNFKEARQDVQQNLQESIGSSQHRLGCCQWLTERNIRNIIQISLHCPLSILQDAIEYLSSSHCRRYGSRWSYFCSVSGTDEQNSTATLLLNSLASHSSSRDLSWRRLFSGKRMRWSVDVCYANSNRKHATQFVDSSVPSRWNRAKRRTKIEAVRYKFRSYSSIKHTLATWCQNCANDNAKFKNCRWHANWKFNLCRERSEDIDEDFFSALSSRLSR